MLIRSTPHTLLDPSREIYFYDPRLSMGVAGRLLIRIVRPLSYVFFAVMTLVLLVSDAPALRWFGAFAVLMLIDALAHLGQADRPLKEIASRGPINVADYMKPVAFRALERAFDRARVQRSIVSLELFRELLKSEEVVYALKRLDFDVVAFEQKAEELLNGSVVGENQLEFLSELLGIAFKKAVNEGRAFVEIPEIFVALAESSSASLGRVFKTFSLTSKDLELAFSFEAAKREFGMLRRRPQVLGHFALEVDRRHLRHRIMNRAWTSRPTPTLDHYATDLTDLARGGQVGFLVGHETEYKRLAETLARSINPNALLIGEPGIGKETIIAHLALELTKDRVPGGLFDKRLVSLDLSMLVAGASPEELQTRIQNITQEIMLAGNIILCIPDIHNLVRTSGTAYLSAADAFIPIIMNNVFPVIGTTYPLEFKQLIEPRSDFVGAFECIRVSEITEQEAQKLLAYESLILENRSKAMISLGAVRTAVMIAKKHFHDKFLPGSAEELLKGALVHAEQRELTVVGPDEVIAVAEEKINVPLRETGKDEAEKLLNLEAVIHERFVDQDEAVVAVSQSLREYRTGLTRPGGPIASFLFVGPTGVGKTELAKTLTKLQFGSIDMMVRFDMTEYQDKQSFYRFIGSPDGSISGALTDAIIAKPYSLILLDEFEKAYPDILGLFLQVLDDGRLTNNLGRIVDFQNTIIIATSNAHSDIINAALREGQTMMQIADNLKKKLTDVFKPELLNRFTKIIIFKDLALPDVKKIAGFNLNDLAKSVSEQGIELAIDPTAIDLVAQLGYDPSFGARPLRRVIEERIRSLLAEKILRQELVRGSRVMLKVENEQFVFANQ